LGHGDGVATNSAKSALSLSALHVNHDAHQSGLLADEVSILINRCRSISSSKSRYIVQACGESAIFLVKASANIHVEPAAVSKPDGDVFERL